MTQHRFSQQSINRYLPVIRTVINSAVPKRFTFDPLEFGLNAETASCRLRDAINAIILGITPQPGINSEELKSKWKHYCVTTEDELVVVKPRAEKKLENNAQVLVSEETDDLLAVVDVTKPDAMLVLDSFATLLGKGFLIGRVKILGSIDLSFVDSIPNVEIVEETPTVHIMF